jgi:hypothetical protein
LFKLTQSIRKKYLAQKKPARLFRHQNSFVGTIEKARNIVKILNSPQLYILISQKCHKNKEAILSPPARNIKHACVLLEKFPQATWM